MSPTLILIAPGEVVSFTSANLLRAGDIGDILGALSSTSWVQPTDLISGTSVTFTVAVKLTYAVTSVFFSSPPAEMGSNASQHTSVLFADSVMNSVANAEHGSYNFLEESYISENFHLMTCAENHQQRVLEVRRRLLQSDADSFRWRDDCGTPAEDDMSESVMPVFPPVRGAAASLISSPNPSASSEMVAKPECLPLSTIPTIAGLPHPQAPPPPSDIVLTALTGVTLVPIEEVEGGVHANDATMENTDLFFRRRMATTDLFLESLNILFEGYFDEDSSSETDSTISETGFEDSPENILQLRSSPSHSAPSSGHISTGMFCSPRLADSRSNGVIQTPASLPADTIFPTLLETFDSYPDRKSGNS